MGNVDKLRGKLHVYFLIIPIYARLIFPEGLEIRLTFEILNYSFFLPEITFFLLPFVAPISSKILSKNIGLILLTLLGLFLGYLSALNGASSNELANFLAGTDFYVTLLLFLLFPLNKHNISYLLKPTFALVTIISLEIVLYSFGILSYEKELSGHDFGGISRISTTIGGSTGSAVAYFLMSVIFYFLLPYKFKKVFFYISFLISSITLTRSVLIANAILLIIVLKEGKKNKLNQFQKLTKFFGILILIIGLFVGLNEIGFFASFSSRSASLDYGGRDLSNGRFERWEASYNFIEQYPLIGSGANYVTEHKRARYASVDCKNLFSPHNTYILVAMERGYIGLLIFLVILFLLVKPLNFKKITVLKASVFLSLLVLMNAEIVFIFSEFAGLFLIIISIFRIEKNKNEIQL